MKASLLSFASIPVALAAVAQQSHQAAHHRAAADAFKAMKWSLAKAGPAVSPSKLDLSPSPDRTEELVVYGKRIRHENHGGEPTDVLTFGPATLTGTTQAGLSSFRGMTITAAVPVPGVTGLDAVLDVSGGHDQVNSSTTATSAAVVAGLKIKF